VFDNLRGDLPVKLGTTYAQLAHMNPRIVCVHLSAYGRSGSRAAWPGFDYLMQAEAGYLSLTGEPDGPPARFGLSMIDLMTGTTAAMALLAGLVDARSTGRGRDLDVSLFDVALHNLAYVATWYLNAGVVTQREPRSSHPSLTPSQLFRTQDGWLFIMCNKQRFWSVLADAVGKPEWTTDAEFSTFAARLKNRDQVTRNLDAVLMTATTKEWMSRLGGKVPVAPVYDVRQALDNPFVTEQQLVLDFEHPEHGNIRGVASPVRLNNGDAPLRRAAPRLGEDTNSLLEELGYSPEAIGALHEQAAVA
jgi:crotonobetainyl-CoA:carnitine CoA-transferase CaiB-like acyl-CoA transferase